MLGKTPHFLARASIFMLPAKVHNHPRTLLAFCANKENDEPMFQYSGKFSSYWDDIIGDAFCSWKNQHNFTLLFAVFFSTDDQIFVDSPYENLHIDVAEYNLEEDLCLEFGCKVETPIRHLVMTNFIVALSANTIAHFRSRWQKCGTVKIRVDPSI